MSIKRSLTDLEQRLLKRMPLLVGKEQREHIAKKLTQQNTLGQKERPKWRLTNILIQSVAVLILFCMKYTPEIFIANYKLIAIKATYLSLAIPLIWAIKKLAKIINEEELFAYEMLIIGYPPEKKDLTDKTIATLSVAITILLILNQMLFPAFISILIPVISHSITLSAKLNIQQRVRDSI